MIAGQSLRPEFVAEQAEPGLSLTLLWQQGGEALVAGCDVEREVDHVVFAFQCAAEDAAGVVVDQCLPADQLRVVAAWAKGDACGAVEEKGHPIAIELAVVGMERREEIVLDDGRVVDVGVEITQHPVPGLPSARYRRGVQEHLSVGSSALVDVV